MYLDHDTRGKVLADANIVEGGSHRVAPAATLRVLTLTVWAHEQMRKYCNLGFSTLTIYYIDNIQISTEVENFKFKTRRELALATK